ncbi:jg2248 [Pararge aegeria aegeria]|uniref:Jg2248 protein n=1 Tax=Pararge aegeria aegeria TaxID=348720 RepID=A0A8S4SNY5_9NEOP|nr:jg2248 [Pararge aegeria aegeria]
MGRNIDESHNIIVDSPLAIPTSPLSGVHGPQLAGLRLRRPEQACVHAAVECVATLPAPAAQLQLRLSGYLAGWLLPRP